MHKVMYFCILNHNVISMPISDHLPINSIDVSRYEDRRKRHQAELCEAIQKSRKFEKHLNHVSAFLRMERMVDEHIRKSRDITEKDRR
jgi:hypothetical protein